MLRSALAMLLFLGVFTAPGLAQDEDCRLFAGALIGISTLSADGRAVIAPGAAATSLYKPENGPALNVFGGIHLSRFLSLQANYIWNRNDLALVSSFTNADRGGFYEQQRRSAQHVAVADMLVYFRNTRSRIRPYLGTGLAVIRFGSSEVVRTIEDGLEAPDGPIEATKVGLRSHVGIDVAVSKRLRIRYSFSETISGNPVSPRLTPPAQRGLANFHNLFGLLAVF
jgi:hypothetical protein